MKNIKDYLYLYLGCEVGKGTNDITYPVLLSVNGDSAYLSEYQFMTPGCDTVFTRPEMWLKVQFIKPILRPLSDMTDEEMEEVWYLIEPKNVLVMEYRNSNMVRKVALCSERTKYLLSRGFDMFGLIDAGLAIDKTKIKHPESKTHEG